MLRHTIFLFWIVFVSITASKPASSEVFTGSGLVDIPTSKVLQHGIFEVGTYLGFQQRIIERPTTNLGDAVAVHLNFGLFDRVEVGVTHLWNQYGEPSSADRTANLKFQLLKEPETGATPSIAIGIEKLGRDIVLWNSEAEADKSASAFLAISKTFNLPRIHQFSGHIGIGTQRFAFSERPIGLFVGVRKEFRPAFARGNITTSLEFDGAGVNVGVRYAAASGLQVALGAETLNTPDELRYLASVSWTNAQILERIDETRRLIKRATALAVQAKRASAEKKQTDNTTERPAPQ